MFDFLKNLLKKKPLPEEIRKTPEFLKKKALSKYGPPSVENLVKAHKELLVAKAYMEEGFDFLYQSTLYDRPSSSEWEVVGKEYAKDGGVILHLSAVSPKSSKKIKVRFCDLLCSLQIGKVFMVSRWSLSSEDGTVLTYSCPGMTEKDLLEPKGLE